MGGARRAGRPGSSRAAEWFRGVVRTTKSTEWEALVASQRGGCRVGGAEEHVDLGNGVRAGHARRPAQPQAPLQRHCLLVTATVARLYVYYVEMPFVCGSCLFRYDIGDERKKAEHILAQAAEVKGHAGAEHTFDD